MKKILIPFCVFFAVGIGFVVFVVSAAYNNVQYAKDTLAHVMAVKNGGELKAEYMGRTTRVLGGNLSRIQRIVTVTERKLLFAKPEYDEGSALRLKFSDGAEYIIANDTAADDGAFVLYSYKGRKLYFGIKGYKTMESAVRAVSPEGYYNANQVIENAGSDK